MRISKVLIVGLAMGFASPALAQVPVDDGKGNALIREQNNTLGNINATAEMTTRATQEINAAIGNQGNMPSPLQGALGDAIGTGAEFYQNMQRFSYDMCAVTLCANNDPVGTTDIEEARTWAMKNLFAKEPTFSK